jgi:hypothetical protein
MPTVTQAANTYFPCFKKALLFATFFHLFFYDFKRLGTNHIFCKTAFMAVTKKTGQHQAGGNPPLHSVALPESYQ